MTTGVSPGKEPPTAPSNRLVLRSDRPDHRPLQPPENPTPEEIQALYQELILTRAALLEVKQEHQTEMQQRLRNESALRLSELRYRAFVAQSTEAIWCFELDRPVPIDLPQEEQLRHLYHHAFLAECNDATARLYGYDDAEEMRGRRLTQLLPAAERGNVESMRLFVRNHYRVADAETRERDRHGRLRYFRNNRVGIVENGTLRRWWGTQRDVTDLMVAESQRDESERRLRLALSAADMGTWDWDIEAGNLLFSPELLRIFGLTAADQNNALLDRARFIAVEDRAHVRRSVFAALRGAAEWECEFRIRRLDGSIRWMLVRGDLVRDENGTPRQMVGAATDITARRQAEAERERIERKMQDTQKLESLGVLAGGIAHDFNNLLTGIIGHADLAQRGEMPGARLRLQEITCIAKRAADLCQQMLAYAGKGRFHVGPNDLSQLIRETAALVQLSISKQAVMVFDLAEHLPAVLADATQLRQIIINLVMNASDAMGSEGGSIVLRTEAFTADRDYFHDARTCPENPEGAYVLLEVTDTGCGMTAETLNRIFDPFFTTKFTGRGLGLAAVIGIVRSHGGALFVNSTPGRGTIFRILLPQASTESDAVHLSPDASVEREGAGTILVVDDEELVRTVTVALVEGAGFAAVAAPGGRQALELFAADPAKFDAALIDVTMPGLDGLEVLSRLRDLRGNIPIVLMSGYSETEVASRCPDLRHTAFLQKPFNREAVVAKLLSVIS